jgi:hypothetical protein
VEDRVWFPAVATRCPEFVVRDLTSLADDHRFLDALVARVDAAIARLCDPTVPFDAARSEAADAVTALAGLVTDHFAHEERTIVPLIDEVCSADDVTALARRADREHSLRELRFLLPWFFDHLSPCERAQVAGEAGQGLRFLHLAMRPGYRRLVRAARLPD